MKIDECSYRCGVMDCFNEMVKAKVKPMALAHPFSTKSQRDHYIPFVEKITQRYQTKYYLDDDPLITDLFPLSQNKDTYNIIFYQDESIIQEYQRLKTIKRESDYTVVRTKLAYAFGHLLGYSDEVIEAYIKNNHEKE